MRAFPTTSGGSTVVKFGGSLVGSHDRDALLRIIARHGVVLAPGGGPFADAVRAAQARHGFSDNAAHRMAILAMDQTAMILADAAPDFALCAEVRDFEQAAADGAPAIWRPSPMALGADIPASWDVTSDSLALWLAITLRAARLLILKAAPAPADAQLEQLGASGIVDPYLPTLARRFPGEIAVIGPARPEALDAALAAPLRRAA